MMHEFLDEYLAALTEERTMIIYALAEEKDTHEVFKLIGQLKSVQTSIQELEIILLRTMKG